MKKIFLAIVMVVLMVAAHSCKTTEKNYRDAYMAAKAKQFDGGDSLVTEGLRNEQMPKPMVLGADTLPVRTEVMYITRKQEFKVPTLGIYNVVAGSFKQLFNAKSFCARLNAQGFEAFLLNNRDQTYYIVTLTTRNPAEAAQGIARLKALDNVRFQPYFPYIIRAGQYVR